MNGTAKTYTIKEIPTPLALAHRIKTPTIWRVYKDGALVTSSYSQDQANAEVAEHQRQDAAGPAKTATASEFAAAKLQAETAQREARYASGIMDGSVFATKETRPANDSFYLEDEERF